MTHQPNKMNETSSTTTTMNQNDNTTTSKERQQDTSSRLSAQKTAEAAASHETATTPTPTQVSSNSTIPTSGHNTSIRRHHPPPKRTPRLHPTCAPLSSHHSSQGNVLPYSTFILLVAILASHAFSAAMALPASHLLRGSTGSQLNRHLIVGGNAVTNVDAYPWFVEWQGRCGGSLIAPDIMLTAAHCDRGRNPFARNVNVGSLFRGDGIARTMALRVEHPLWDPSFSSRSIAWDFLVVKLNETVPDVTPVPFNMDPALPQGGDPVTAMGFGNTQHRASGRPPNRIREVDISAFSNEQCQDVYSTTRVIFQEDNMLCAGVRGGGKGTCQGDSGGPLITEDGVQVGVVSWGEGCGHPGYPGVYARVSAAQEWIQEQVCRWSCDPPLGACPPDILEQNLCLQPNTGKVNLVLRVVHDQFPAETGIIWEHVESATQLLFQDYGSHPNGTDINGDEDPIVVEHSVVNGRAGTYKLIVADSGRDGICCDNGEGSVTILNSDTQEVLYFNDTFREKMRIYLTVDEEGNLLSTATDSDADLEYEQMMKEEGVDGDGNDVPDDEDLEDEEDGTFTPESDDSFPGELPSMAYQVYINVRYDFYQDETDWKLERLVQSDDGSSEALGGDDSEVAREVNRQSELNMDNFTQLAEDDWNVVAQKDSTGVDRHDFVATLVDLQPNSLFRFTITDERFDNAGDGICCDHGNGWVTITNSSTVVWQLIGNDFATLAWAFVWVDEFGHVREVDYKDGEIVEKTEAPTTASPTTDSPTTTKPTFAPVPLPTVAPSVGLSSSNNFADEDTDNSDKDNSDPNGTGEGEEVISIPVIGGEGKQETIPIPVIEGGPFDVP